MTSRQLKVVATGKVVGAIDDQASSPFEGGAAAVLQPMRTRIGDERTLAQVLRDGWSNGYLYFGDPVKS